MGLGVVAFLLGAAAAGAGAYVGFAANGVLVALPGGLPAMPPETVATGMLAVGLVTMLLGLLSITRANEY
jgi:hypothetical protein